MELQLICGGTLFHLQLTAKQGAVELFDKLDKPFRVLFTAGGLGKLSPILRLRFHQITSEVLNLIW